MWGWGWVKVYVPNDKPVVRRQLVRVSSLCESQGLNSGCWAWWQNPFLAVPFCQLSSFERAEKKNLFSVPVPAMFLMNTSPVLCVIRGVKEEHSGVSVGAERKFQGRAAGCLCSIIFQLYKKNKADCWNPQSWLSG